MRTECTAHIPDESTDKTCMPGGGDPDDSTAPCEKDDANIRWLLAAVLHHESDDELDGSDG